MGEQTLLVVAKPCQFKSKRPRVRTARLFPTLARSLLHVSALAQSFTSLWLVGLLAAALISHCRRQEQLGHHRRHTNVLRCLGRGGHADDTLPSCESGRFPSCAPRTVARRWSSPLGSSVPCHSASGGRRLDRLHAAVELLADIARDGPDRVTPSLDTEGGATFRAQSTEDRQL